MTKKTPKMKKTKITATRSCIAFVVSRTTRRSSWFVVTIAMNGTTVIASVFLHNKDVDCPTTCVLAAWRVRHWDMSKRELTFFNAQKKKKNEKNAGKLNENSKEFAISRAIIIAWIAAAKNSREKDQNSAVTSVVLLMPWIWFNKKNAKTKQIGNERLSQKSWKSTKSLWMQLNSNKNNCNYNKRLWPLKALRRSLLLIKRYRRCT